MACPRFDPTVDNNSWLKEMIDQFSSQELILMLSDARVASSVNLTAMLQLAMNTPNLFRRNVHIGIILAAHPNVQLTNSCPYQEISQIANLLAIAKNRNGVLCDGQMEQIIDADQDVQMAILYACLCSGNIETLRWMQNSIFRGKFKGVEFNILYFGEPKLQLASTAACHGHLHLVKYLLGNMDLDEEDLNRILDVAHKANRVEVADWAVAQLRDYDQDVDVLYKIMNHVVNQAVLPPPEFIQGVITLAKRFSTSRMACPAIARQIVRDLEYHVALTGLLSWQLPMEIAVMFAEAVRQHPMPINGHVI